MSRGAVTILLVVLAGLAFVVVAQGASLPLPGNQIGYEPVQPVAFSHLLHAGELKIDCRFCHLGAETSRHAGLPPTQVCMACHKVVTAPLAMVREEERRAAAAVPPQPPRPVTSPEIAKLYRAMGWNEKGEPIPGAERQSIPWVRVHNLPDHVAFDHRPHVAAGVACAECHGPVESMARVRQSSDLSMGWCVNCHRRAQVPPIKGGPPGPASTDCSVCHH